MQFSKYPAGIQSLVAIWQKNNSLSVIGHEPYNIAEIGAKIFSDVIK